jgi:cobalt-zinc-cadmium efflux system protein
MDTKLHDHDHHHSLPARSQSGRKHALLWPLLITLGFALIEAIGGWLTGSLALLGDAGHMFSDSVALGLAWLGAWIASKPASHRYSFGLMRAEVIVALLNGLIMLAVVAFIVFEAIQRLHAPKAVLGGEVMLIATIGLIVNIVVARQLHQHQHSINNRAALLHVMGDLLGSVAAIAAGAIIYFTGWMPIDPILSIFISTLILFATVNLLRQVLGVLMESVPPHIEIATVSQALTALPLVQEVHSVHIWALSSEITALSAHVVLTDMQSWRTVLEDMRAILHERFAIDHVTLQPETTSTSDNGCWLTRKID